MELLSVGEVAARLGVSTSAVRMWGSRYGLTASARTEGGHRRFTPEDVAALAEVHRAVIAGADPGAAAAAVTGRLPEVDRSATARRGGAGGSVLAVPGAGREARGLARAASRLDVVGTEDTVLAVLGRSGTLSAWDEVVRPVLTAAGRHWQRTGDGIEVEHLLTQAVTTALVRHAAAMPPPPAGHPVLLAAGPREDHVLPLHAVRAALAERGVPARLLGPRTPLPALTSAARRTRAAAVLVWLSVADDAAVDELPGLLATHRRLRVLVGGPGWDGADVGDGTRVADLAEAVGALAGAWQAAGGSGRESPQ